MADFQKIWNENGISVILLGIVVVYGIVMVLKYTNEKGNATESMKSNANAAAYTNSSSQNTRISNSTRVNTDVTGVQPADPLGQSTQFASAHSSGQPISSCSKASDPSQLLPKDTNNQWSKTNPMGQGSLANVQLLKSGEHIGINTIGSSLKNPNLQLRSEPRVPRVDTGPWNQSSYEPDLMRLPFEINACGA